MIRMMRLLVGMVAFLVIYGFVIAPSLETAFTAMSPFFQGAIGISVVENTQTVLYLGLPLIMLGGIIVVSFVIAVGLRGTSFG